MSRLGHISGVETVVIRHVLVIVILQGHHIHHECVCWDLKRLEQISFLKREVEISYKSQLNATKVLKKRNGQNKTYLEDCVHNASKGPVV